MDATDSGLSIDKIIDVKEQLFKTILQDNPDKDILYRYRCKFL